MLAWNRERRTGYYFTLPNVIFSLGLSYGEIAVYAYLLYRENRRSHECHPSYRTIGDALGMTKNTVKKYVGLLEEHELIITRPSQIRTRDGSRRNGNLIYHIQPIVLAEQYRQRHLKDAAELALERARVQRWQRAAQHRPA